MYTRARLNPLADQLTLSLSLSLLHRRLSPPGTDTLELPPATYCADDVLAGRAPSASCVAPSKGLKKIEDHRRVRGRGSEEGTCAPLISEYEEYLIPANFLDAFRTCEKFLVTGVCVFSAGGK